jgi:hypothetical protein
MLKLEGERLIRQPDGGRGARIARVESERRATAWMGVALLRIGSIFKPCVFIRCTKTLGFREEEEEEEEEEVRSLRIAPEAVVICRIGESAFLSCFP